MAVIKKSRLIELFLVLCFSLSALSVDVDELQLTAEAPAGLFKGKHRTSSNGRGFVSFSGIPYAKPPVGERRFKIPERLDKLEGEFDATKEGSECSQLNFFQKKLSSNLPKFIGNEDCLFLNVYTPKVNPERLYPVMVYIHGGAFIFGSGSEMMAGPELFLNKDVVVVNINYRLGIFGFLTIDGAIAGNIGLRDQNMALQWVKENIKSFGGDPNKVTIFGISAGAASVHFQMLSPMSKGLFQKGISQSGSADCIWAIGQKETVQNNTDFVLNSVGCNVDKSEILNCLQSKPANELLETSQKLKKFLLDIEFRPTLEPESETAFLTESSILHGSELPWISGLTNAEGLAFLEDFFGSGNSELKNFEKDYADIFAGLFQYRELTNKDEITEKLKNFYLGEENFSTEPAFVKGLIMLLSDGWFVNGLRRSSEKHKGRLYLYSFNHVGNKHFTDLSLVGSEHYGASHGDDSFYVFHVKNIYPNLDFTDKDKKVSELMIDLWTSFADTGKPSSPLSDVKWPQSKKKKKYTVINSNGLEVKNNLFDNRLKIWDTIHNHETLPVKEEL